LTSLSIDSYRAVSDRGDGSVVLDSIRSRLVSADSNASGEEVSRVRVGLKRYEKEKALA
jgi:hypothetical protein